MINIDWWTFISLNTVSIGRMANSQTCDTYFNKYLTEHQERAPKSPVPAEIVFLKNRLYCILLSPAHFDNVRYAQGIDIWHPQADFT